MAGKLDFSLLLSVVDKATAPLKSVSTALAGMSKGAGEALKATGESLAKVGDNLKNARESVEDFSGKLTAGLQSIIAPSLEVDNALAQVAATSGKTGADETATLDKLKASALAWSSAHTQSTATYVATANTLVKAGLNEAAAVTATETALRVATATGKDSGAVAETLSIIYGQLGDKTKDAGAEFARLGDVLAKAGQTFNGLDISQLSDPLKDAIPAAKQAGVGVEQLVTILGQFNAAGIKGGEAGAEFAAVVGSLDAASQKLGITVAKNAQGQTDLIGTFQNLQAKYGDLSKASPQLQAQLADAFGPGWKGASALAGSLDTLSANYAKVQNSAGTASTAQQALESTTSAQMQIATQKVDALKVELAAGLAPAIQQLLPPFQAVITAIAGFAKEHPGIVSWVGTVAILAAGAGAVLGPILSAASALSTLGSAAATAGGWILETLLPGIWAQIAPVLAWAGSLLGGLVPALIAGTASALAFAAAMLANPITWIVLAIVALAVVVYKYWDPISKFFEDLWGSVKVYFVAAWNVITGLWDKVVGIFTGIWDDIKGSFEKGFVQGVFTVLSYLSPIGLIIKVWGKLLPYFGELFGSIGDTILNAIKSIFGDKVAGVFAGIWNDIKSAFQDGFVKGVLTVLSYISPVAIIARIWGALIPYFVGLLSSVGKAIWDGIKAAVATVVGIFTTVYDNWINSWKMIGSWLAGLGATVAGYFSTMWSSAIASITGFFSQWYALIQQGIAQVTGFFTSIWNSIATAFSGGISGILGLLASFSPVNLVIQAFNSISQWLGGFSLADAGKNIIGTITSGIEAAASAPYDALKGIIQKMRNLLPFSPAKEGPFTDLHKVQIVETVAQNIKPAPLVDAMTNATGAAMDAVRSLPAPPTSPALPAYASSPASSSGAAGTGEASGPISITIQLGGGADGAVDQLEAWLSNPSNARRVMVAAQRAAALDARTDLK